jgi:SUF system FeS cluster assembly, SufBD
LEAIRSVQLQALITKSIDSILKSNNSQQIYATSTNYGVVFGNWNVGELTESQKVTLPKEFPKLYFIFLTSKRCEADWQFEVPKNSELVIINILFDRDCLNLNLSQNILVKNPNSKISQTTIGIQNHESEFTINQKIDIKSTAIDSKISQYIKILKLNPKAKTTTNPILKINCPKVVASHGVAIGGVDQSSKLILQSRGIKESEAQKILKSSFVIRSLPKELELCWRDVINKELHKLLYI